jgi:hypothetical protein
MALDVANAREGNTVESHLPSSCQSFCIHFTRFSENAEAFM